MNKLFICVTIAATMLLDGCGSNPAESAARKNPVAGNKAMKARHNKLLYGGKGLHLINNKSD